ncbi:hypothetical protein R6Q57_006005 [Mikania cordata]
MNRIPDLNEDPCVESFYDYENQHEFGWESQPSYRHESLHEENDVCSEPQNSGHDYFDGGHHAKVLWDTNQKAVDWDVLTKIRERARAENWIGEETPWRRLFDMALQPSYREVTVEFLSTFTYYPAAVLEVVFSMLGQRHEMSLFEYAVLSGLYWEPETPLYTARITEIDDATLRAW